MNPLILQQADNFTNSLGILQQSATPTPFQGISASNKSKSDTAAGKSSTDATEKIASNAVNGNTATAVNGASQLQQQEGECAQKFIARNLRGVQNNDLHLSYHKVLFNGCYFAVSDHTNLFAQLISRTAKDIELLIDSLPAEESSLQLQEASLIELEKQNSEAAQKLEDVVKQGEAILQEIQSALHDVAQQQLEIQKLET